MFFNEADLFLRITHTHYSTYVMRSLLDSLYALTLYLITLAHCFPHCMSSLLILKHVLTSSLIARTY